MKTKFLTLLMLAVSPALPAAGVTLAVPVQETNGKVEILMADGTAATVLKITGISSQALHVMTNDGVVKIPLNKLHSQSLLALNSITETQQEQLARLQREAVTQEQYRKKQAEKERMVAQENAQNAAALREEAAREEAARKAAAEARARQQQYLIEIYKVKEAQKTARLAQRAAAERERDRMEEAERQRQYQLQLATIKVQQAQSVAAIQQAAGVHIGPLSAMMTPRDRTLTGVDKLQDFEQLNLTNWLAQPLAAFPGGIIGMNNLAHDEKSCFISWLNQKRVELNPHYVASPGQGLRLPVKSWISGADFVGFQKGRVYKLGNGQSWVQISDKSQSYYPDMSGNVRKVYIEADPSSACRMIVDGVGEVLVKPGW